MSNPKLEGWLIKKRGDYHKNKFLGKDNMRWFKLQEVTGTDHAELALCYFKSQKEKEPKGWIFLKDIYEVRDTFNSFTIISPGRTMTIECQTPHEQFLWLKNLLECCQNADISRVFSISTEFLKNRKSINTYKEESKSSFDRSSILFSRNSDEANETGNCVNIENEESENIPNSNQQNTNTDDDTNSDINTDINDANKKSNLNFKNSTRGRTNQRKDHRNIRNSGNLGMSTSNRLSKHIARDGSPSMINRGNHNRTTSNEEIDQLQAKSDSIPSKYIQEKNLKSNTVADSGKEVEDITLETDEVMKNRAKLRDRRKRNNQTRTHRKMDGGYGSHTDEYNSQYNNDNSSDSSSSSETAISLMFSRHNRDSKHTDNDDGIESNSVNCRNSITHAPPRRVRDMIDEESSLYLPAKLANNKQRVSIDEYLLIKRDNITIADSKLDDSRSDEEVDFKEEMRKYNTEPTLQQQHQRQESKDTNHTIQHRNCNCSNIYRTCECTNISRPPRCPPTGAPPYNLSLAINNHNNNHNNKNIGKENALYKFRVAGTRSYTPPRKSADSGSKVDENFVNDNWDDDDDLHQNSDDLIAQNKDDKTYTKISVHNNNNNNTLSNGIKKQPVNIRNVTYGKTIEADRNWLHEDFDEN